MLALQNRHFHNNHVTMQLTKLADVLKEVMALLHNAQRAARIVESNPKGQREMILKIMTEK
ncbi:MAG: hypothetical protein HWE34_17505 [Methylocystaceae bacterium]|nr:hypothetical protein [Methylocystaceae bacterium]